MQSFLLNNFEPILAVLSALFGGFMSWTATKYEVKRQHERMNDMEKRVDALEQAFVRNQLEQADRMARIETNLNNLTSALARIEASLIRLESK